MPIVLIYLNFSKKKKYQYLSSYLNTRIREMLECNKLPHLPIKIYVASQKNILKYLCSEKTTHKHNAMKDAT
jgi:hypothetical protein